MVAKILGPVFLLRQVNIAGNQNEAEMKDHN